MSKKRKWQWWRSYFHYEMGERVEVLAFNPGDEWVKGTIVVPYLRSFTRIVVHCDKPWRSDGSRVYHLQIFGECTEDINRCIRLIKEPKRELCLLEDSPVLEERIEKLRKRIAKLQAEAKRQGIRLTASFNLLGPKDV